VRSLQELHSAIGNGGATDKTDKGVQ